MGFEKGFSIYDDEMKSIERNRNLVERVAPDTTAAALDIIENYCNSKRDKPLFLWIHYQDPHGPYTAPESFQDNFPIKDYDCSKHVPAINKSDIGIGGIPAYQVIDNRREVCFYVSQYDAEIRYFDFYLGELLNEIRGRGLFKNSIFILTSDHGEGLGAHNYYFAHGETLFNDLINVPLILHIPGLGSGKETRVTRHIDLLPTILDALGISIALPFRGTSLLESSDGNPVVLSEIPTGCRHSLIIHPWKLIGKPPHSLLYNIEEDFSETEILSNKEISGKLLEELEKMESSNLYDVAPEEVHLSEEDKAVLRALGYM